MKDKNDILRKLSERFKNIMPKIEIKVVRDGDSENEKTGVKSEAAEQIWAVINILENAVKNLEEKEPDDVSSDNYTEWLDARDELENLLTEAYASLDLLEAN